jgi:hypothetical protein
MQTIEGSVALLLSRICWSLMGLQERRWNLLEVEGACWRWMEQTELVGSGWTDQNVLEV